VTFWDTFDLELNGSTLDVPRLEKYHKSEESRCIELMQIAEETYGLKLAGTGSDAPLRQLMLDAITEADLLSDDRIMRSEKTGKISIGVENVNLVKQFLPPGRSLEIISLFQEFKERSKIVSTYTRPLLFNPRRGITIRDRNIGYVFPSWYPIPTYSERGGSSEDKAGGQIQGRFSCRGPARQTEPQSIRDCSTSRFCGGKLVEYDVAQDHLRMAALLSGDPGLMQVYTEEKESIHISTTSLIFPEVDPYEEKRNKTWKYQLGKDTNLAIIFRVGASTLQDMAMSYGQKQVPIKFCQGIIEKWAGKYPVYWGWQDRMIDLAARQGYLVIE